MAKFQVLRWQGTIDRAVRGFSRIDEIVETAGPNADVKPMGTVDPGHPNADLLNALLQMQHKSHQLTFEEARAIYRRQMIVYGVTLLEAMIKDFAEQLFICHPHRMIRFVGHADSNTEGMAPLKLILSSESKHEIVLNLARDASSRVASRLKQTKFSRIESVGKRNLDNELKEQLIEVIDLRNRIVHERSDEEVSLDRVLKWYNMILRSVSNELEMMAVGSSVPTDREELLQAIDMLRNKQDV